MPLSAPFSPGSETSSNPEEKIKVEDWIDDVDFHAIPHAQENQDVDAEVKNEDPANVEVKSEDPANDAEVKNEDPDVNAEVDMALPDKSDLSMPDAASLNPASPELPDYEPEPMDVDPRVPSPRNAIRGPVRSVFDPFGRLPPRSPERLNRRDRSAGRKPLPSLFPIEFLPEQPVLPVPPPYRSEVTREQSLRNQREDEIQKANYEHETAEKEYERLKAIEAMAAEKKAMEHSVKRKEQLLREMLKKSYKMQLAQEKNPFASFPDDDKESKTSKVSKGSKEQRRKKPMRALREKEKKQKGKINTTMPQGWSADLADPLALVCKSCRSKLCAPARRGSLTNLHILCPPCQSRLHRKLIVPPHKAKITPAPKAKKANGGGGGAGGGGADGGDVADGADVAAGVAGVAGDVGDGGDAGGAGSAGGADAAHNATQNADQSQAGEQQQQENQEPSKWSVAWLFDQLRMNKLRSQREQQREQQPRAAHPAIARNAPSGSAPVAAHVADADENSDSEASAPVTPARRKPRAIGGVRKMRTPRQPHGPNDPRLFFGRS